MDDLAEELVNHICGFADTTSCASLSRVSKKMHRIVEPHLYSKVHIILPWCEVGDYSNSRGLRRTLQTNPHLRPLVKKISAGTLVESRATKSPVTWLECQRYVSDIVALSSRLEAIDMEGYFAHERRLSSSHLFRIFVVDLRSSPCHFDYLKRIDGSIGWTLNDLFHDFSLPSLETLNIHGGYDTVFFDSRWRDLQSTVKHLSFADIERGYSDTSKVFPAIAQSCSRLESLRVLGKDKSYGRNFFQAVVSAFTGVTVQTQLSELELWEDNRPPLREVYFDSFDLSNFGHNITLERLDMDVSILSKGTAVPDDDDDGSSWTPWDISLELPRNLKTLQLRVSHPFLANRLVDRLEELCNSDIKAMLPKLQELRVRSEYIEDEGLEEMKTKFQQQGVRFSVRKLE
ncbi:hypothetical protein K491DRAFT_149112 [Lophiostoma macrostomum CBS 122681]|uniref:F-box domain-containing protein n=1 Tax=Lophiostoma macrostomum CBS 122681 TaxID=1314788 RepID=A0A6A6SSZ4_9PLEO|nr:hypothetical protein K491DRAFT_149112 [Lophiostoma macrostomum CBS 122681]